MDDEGCQVMVKNRYDPTSNKQENCKGTFFKENKIIKMSLKKINIPYTKTQNIVLASSSELLAFFSWFPTLYIAPSPMEDKLKI